MSIRRLTLGWEYQTLRIVTPEDTITMMAEHIFHPGCHNYLALEIPAPPPKKKEHANLTFQMPSFEYLSHSEADRKLVYSEAELHSGTQIKDSSKRISGLWLKEFALANKEQCHRAKGCSLLFQQCLPPAWCQQRGTVFSGCLHCGNGKMAGLRKKNKVPQCQNSGQHNSPENSHSSAARSQTATRSSGNESPRTGLLFRCYTREKQQRGSSCLWVGSSESDLRGAGKRNWLSIWPTKKQSWIGWKANGGRRERGRGDGRATRQGLGENETLTSSICHIILKWPRIKSQNKNI